MRSALIATVVALAGCSQTPTTPPGTLAHIDLRTKLPKDAPPPPSSGGKSYERTFPACEATEVKVSWRAFEAGAQKYLLDVDVALTKPQDAVEVKIAPDLLVGGKSLTAGDPWVGVAHLNVRCHKKTLRYEGETMSFVEIFADGTADGS